MEYVLLMVANEATATATDDELQAQWPTHDDYLEKLTAAGVVRGGRPLQPADAATTVRSGDGLERLVTDGPYAEAKEHIAGYYEVEVADLDEALRWAKQLPLLPGGAAAGGMPPEVDMEYVLPIRRRRRVPRARRGDGQGHVRRALALHGRDEGGRRADPLFGGAEAAEHRAHAGHADGTVTDGPFAETKEQLGGFYVVEVPTASTRRSVGDERSRCCRRQGRGATGQVSSTG